MVSKAERAVCFEVKLTIYDRRLKLYDFLSPRAPYGAIASERVNEIHTLKKKWIHQLYTTESLMYYQIFPNIVKLYMHHPAS